MQFRCYNCWKKLSWYLLSCYTSIYNRSRKNWTLVIKKQYNWAKSNSWHNGQIYMLFASREPVLLRKKEILAILRTLRPLIPLLFCSFKFTTVGEELFRFWRANFMCSLDRCCKMISRHKRDGKIRTAGAHAISQSGSRIEDSGPLLCLRKNKYRLFIIKKRMSLWRGNKTELACQLRSNPLLH